MEPPWNPAAPAPSGRVAETSRRLPLTAAESGPKARARISVAPPGVPRNCRGGFTWKGRTARKRVPFQGFAPADRR